MQQSMSPRVVDAGQRQTTAEPRLPRLTGWARPAVDVVAGIRLSIHQKLVTGFLIIAVLLMGMGVLSLVVIGQMDQRMDRLAAQARKVDLAEQMLYDVTAQSHYRAMALLTRRTDPRTAAGWNRKVVMRKGEFLDKLTKLERIDPANADFYRTLRAKNLSYARASSQVVKAYDARQFALAERWHLAKEHKASHVIEDLLASCGAPGTNPCYPRFGEPFISRAQGGMAEARRDFQSERTLLSKIVIAFSAMSVAAALALGFALSWAFLLPVKKMQHALARITAGDLGQGISVPNRDEFGGLAHDLNRTSQRLGESFEQQATLAQTLRETNADLAAASEAKSRFLASVSHELRTPMNAILGFTDALLAGVDGPLNEEQQESLGWVQHGGQDLLQLINEILDLSKIEAGKLTLNPQPFDPRELVDSVVQQYRPIADQKGLDLGWHASGLPEAVELDRQRVRQILANIVGNALKFTEQGRVDLEARSSDIELWFSVRDTGPGIPEDEQEAIFEEFSQAGTDVRGTGLGLAISRRLARAMGGDITVSSEPSQGSVFEVRLPLDSRNDPSAVPTQSRRHAPQDQERVLLSVDDDPSMAHLLQKLLVGSDYRVVAAGSPRSAVADARRLQPDGILLDLLMKERAGEEVLAELKADGATREIPVIVVSVVDPADRPTNADASLGKPVDKSALLDALAGVGRGTRRS